MSVKNKVTKCVKAKNPTKGIGVKVKKQKNPTKLNLT